MIISLVLPEGIKREGRKWRVARAVQVSFPVLLFLVGLQAAFTQVPQLTIDPVTQIFSTYAIVTGTVNPNGVPARLTVQWGPTTTYGSESPFYPVFAMSVATNVTVTMAGLTPSTTYHLRLMATNSAGVGYSADTTLTTPAGQNPDAGAPSVTVDPASAITSTTAAVTGTVDPKGQPASCFVEWGTTIAYGNIGPIIPVPLASTVVVVSNVMIFLNPSTAYHYRLVATNSSGIGYSADMTVTTAAPPVGQPPAAVTQPATAITTTDANLWGLVSPGGLFTTFFFQWGLDTTYGGTLPRSWLASNDLQVNVFALLTGLNPGTTYHFRIVATNTAGIAYGADQTLTTQGFLTNGVHVFTYLVTNGTLVITRYNGPGGEVTIPSTMLGLPVTAIGDAAFADVPALTSVTIPNGITTLGTSAFADDIALTNVLLPESLTSIGDNAFISSGLTHEVIPDSVTRIGSSAFAWCSGLAGLTLGNHVSILGAQAFSFCPKLTRVVLPDSVTRIEDGYLDWGGPIGLFGHCSGLTNITLGSGIAYIGTGAFVSCPNLTGVYFRGNAPALNGGMFGERIFDYSESVIVYYLADASGWGATYAGRPTMLWNASVQVVGGTFGMSPNGFGFYIEGATDVPVVIEASTDPVAGPWVPVQTCTLTNGSFHFTDPDRTNTYSARFFRVRSRPQAPLSYRLETERLGASAQTCLQLE